jgi:hypothetical protein
MLWSIRRLSPGDNTETRSESPCTSAQELRWCELRRWECRNLGGSSRWGRGRGRLNCPALALARQRGCRCRCGSLCREVRDSTDDEVFILTVWQVEEGLSALSLTLSRAQKLDPLALLGRRQRSVAHLCVARGRWVLTDARHG